MPRVDAGCAHALAADPEDVDLHKPSVDDVRLTCGDCGDEGINIASYQGKSENAVIANNAERMGKNLWTDGAEGELVLTSLTKQAMPVIRYRTRDLTRLLPPSARSMRRMARIAGRSDDMLIIRGVNVFPSQIEELVLRQNELSPHYVIELERNGQLDAISVRCELRPNASSAARSRDASALMLQQQIKAYIGISARVEVGQPGCIERSVGKAKRIVDKRTLLA